MDDTVALVDILTREVEKRYETGNPLRGTQLGIVLHEEFIKSGRPVGRGAYRPIVEEAIRQQRIRREHSGAIDYLVPFRAPSPPAGATASSEPAGPSGTADRSRRGGRYLKKELYRAFTGLDVPRYIDASQPPNLAVALTDGAGRLPVEPVPVEKVKELWLTFAAEENIVEAAKLVPQFDTAAGAWSWLTIPGDVPTMRWGVHFQRRRVELLLSHIHDWARRHQIDLARYDLYMPAAEPVSTSTPVSHRTPAPRTGMAEELRRRIHAAIDQMSLQQLCELKIPSEFLLG